MTGPKRKGRGHKEKKRGGGGIGARGEVEGEEDQDKQTDGRTDTSGRLVVGHPFNEKERNETL
jgi:hypothetical protein